MRSGHDETRAPKYAHIERERRWRVDVVARPQLAQRDHVLIEDRYICGTRLRLRRMIDSTTGQMACKLTKKYPCADPLARPIVTAYMTQQEYDVFVALPAFVLRKKRYHLTIENSIWGLDCFDGALSGLELLEIEWPDDAGLRQLVAPQWALEDVSDNPLYQGGSLAELGLPEG